MKVQIGAAQSNGGSRLKCLLQECLNKIVGGFAGRWMAVNEPAGEPAEPRRTYIQIVPQRHLGSPPPALFLLAVPAPGRVNFYSSSLPGEMLLAIRINRHGLPEMYACFPDRALNSCVRAAQKPAKRFLFRKSCAKPPQPLNAADAAPFPKAASLFFSLAGIEHDPTGNRHTRTASPRNPRRETRLDPRPCQ